MSYLDHTDKQVVGTTYKDLHQLVDQVAESGFFDAVNQASAEPADEVAPASDEVEEPTEPEPSTEGNGTSAVAYQSCLFISAPN